MNFEQLKEMVIMQECYQFKGLFEAVGMDWRPTDEMMERIKGKELIKDQFPLDLIIDNIEDYKELLGLNEFEKELLN